MSGGAERSTVLLVEDNEAIRHAFTILLEECGYRTLSAGTGREAIGVAERERPGLVILDLGLPDMNGLDVARHLRAHSGTREIPIVALTGRALEVDQEACMAAGCTGYLTKPIDTEQLLGVIGSHLGSRE